MSLPDAGKTPPLLQYESNSPANTAGPRPRWVYFVIGIYLLLLAAMLLLPAWLRVENHSNDGIGILIIYFCVLVVCGLSLMILPVRALRQRPVSRKSIWFSVIGSGLLAGSLLLGAGLALEELMYGEHTEVVMILMISIMVWMGWSVIFATIGIGSGADGIGMKLHRLLIAGSVLELLIAVPAHLVVRRRTYCCAGLLTGTGICIGVSIMLVSLGPSVLILYHRRYKQILPPQVKK